MADKHDIQQFFVATDADDGEVQSMKQTRCGNNTDHTLQDSA